MNILPCEGSMSLSRSTSNSYVENQQTTVHEIFFAEFRWLNLGVYIIHK